MINNNTYVHYLEYQFVCQFICQVEEKRKNSELINAPTTRVRHQRRRQFRTTKFHGNPT